MTVGIAESASLKFSMSLLDYYRCADVPHFGLSTELGVPSGFFRFGQDVVCYGQTAGETRSAVNGHLFDASKVVGIDEGSVLLPFDITQVADNLRFEAYV